MENQNQTLDLTKNSTVLTEGAKLNLTKAADTVNAATGNTSAPAMEELQIGLGWDPKGEGEFDADGVVFVFRGDDEKCDPTDAIYFNNLVTPDGSQRAKADGTGFEVVTPGYVTHYGDNRTGVDNSESDKDDEKISFFISKLPADFKKAAIYVSIFQGNPGEAPRNQNFGMVNNAFVRCVNKSTGDELARFELDFDADTATCLRFGTIIKRDSGEIFFQADKQPVVGGINELMALHVR